MLNMTKHILVAALALALAPFALAQSMEGKDAPSFDATVCVNQPEATTFEQCKGDVVLLKWWGTR